MWIIIITKLISFFLYFKFVSVSIYVRSGAHWAYSTPGKPHTVTDHIYKQHEIFF